MGAGVLVEPAHHRGGRPRAYGLQGFARRNLPESEPGKPAAPAVLALRLAWGGEWYAYWTSPHACCSTLAGAASLAAGVGDAGPAQPVRQVLHTWLDTDSPRDRHPQGQSRCLALHWHG